MNWWESIEAHLATREEGSPDPWAHTDVPADDAALTDEQEAFLAGLADQPAPPRIADPDRSGSAGETT